MTIIVIIWQTSLVDMIITSVFLLTFRLITNFIYLVQRLLLFICSFFIFVVLSCYMKNIIIIYKVKSESQLLQIYSRFVKIMSAYKLDNIVSVIIIFITPFSCFFCWVTNLLCWMFHYVYLVILLIVTSNVYKIQQRL